MFVSMCMCVGIWGRRPIYLCLCVCVLVSGDVCLCLCVLVSGDVYVCVYVYVCWYLGTYIIVSMCMGMIQCLLGHISHGAVLF